MPLSLSRAHSQVLSCIVTPLFNISKYTTFKPITQVPQSVYYPSNKALPKTEFSKKYYVKIEFRKSQKTRSDSNSDSNIRVQVRNAGPYLATVLILSDLRKSKSSYDTLSTLIEYNVLFECITLLTGQDRSIKVFHFAEVSFRSPFNLIHD